MSAMPTQLAHAYVPTIFELYMFSLTDTRGTDPRSILSAGEKQRQTAVHYRSLVCQVQLER